MRDVGRRITALEARISKRRVIRPLTREVCEKVARMKAAVITRFLGGWAIGDDAYEVFEQTMLRATAVYCKPDLGYASMQAEWLEFRGYSGDGLAGRINRLWDQDRKACAALYVAFADILARYPELDLTPPGEVITPSFMGRVVTQQAA